MPSATTDPIPADGDDDDDRAGAAASHPDASGFDERNRDAPNPEALIEGNRVATREDME